MSNYINDNFKTSIKEWMDCDDLIQNLNSQLKELRTKRNDIKQELTHFMETNNLINDKRYEKEISEMKEIIFNDWNIDEVKNRAIENQKNRLFIHKVTKGDPTYVNLVKFDDDKRYIRNAGAADTKAKARFPYVEPAKPDKKL